MKRYFVFVMLLCCAAFAQKPAPQSAPKADTVSRTTKAVNYRHKGGATKIDFRGTELMQAASGEGKVESKNGHIEIDVQLDGIEDATKFGLEYLTYVLWAISPQGRPVNLGEALLDHGKSRVRAVTELQTFGMIVTAEPYFAVTQPGNMVVMENVVRSDTAGRQENIDARYELIGRGNYSSSNAPIRDAIFGIDRKTPLDLFQARNAVRIAHLAGADKYAPAIMVKAQQQLSQAEDAYRLKRGKNAISTAARETAETCEEARVISLKQKAEEDAQARSAADRKAAEEREAKARADAEAEGRRRADAEAARAQAEAARAQAEAARSDAERMKREAEAAAQEAARQKQEADAAKAAALAQQEQLAAEAEKARNAAQEADRLRQQAEKEKADLRARLLQQLNSILSTRDTARGLIANMSDVLFETGKYQLRAEARERLAKVSGIVLAYPSLHLDVEGHTDSVGSDEYNQQLSEFRAQSVRNYLVQEGVAPNSIAARGLGKTQPIAPNDTAEGRQKNRRVELVLSGDAIGMNVADAQPVAQSATTPRQ